jgi:internalin A
MLDQVIDGVVRLIKKHWPRRREAFDYEVFDIDQATLELVKAFSAWKDNERRARFLLKAQDLRLIERFEDQIHWGTGEDEQERRYFFDLSKRRRRLDRIILGATILYLVGVAGLAAFQYPRAGCRNYLRDSGYPPELCDWQGQLKVLKLRQPLDLESFSGLNSKTIEDLEIIAEPSSNSIAGLSSLSKCRSLKKLSLVLDGSAVSDVRPLEKLSGLTHLTLSLGSEVSDVQPLEKLSGLTQLDLNMRDSKVTDLRPLEGLNALTHLTLKFRYEMADLKPLEKLSALSTLTLDSFDLQSTDLSPLEKLSGLANLTINLRYVRYGDLERLEKISRLNCLSLDLGGSNVGDLRTLEKLSGLTQLKLSLRNSKMRDLRLLGNLTRLTYLDLDISDCKVGDLKPLEKMTGLTRLDLNLRNCEVSDLTPLEKLSELTRLSLVLSASKVNDICLLEKLSGLTWLSIDLRASAVKDLTSLVVLSRLTHLDLDLTSIEAVNLKPLEKLSALTQITLKQKLAILSEDSDFVKSLESVGCPTKLALNAGYGDALDNSRQLVNLRRLNQLSLDLDFRDTDGSYLKPLEKLQGLSELNLRYSKTQLSGLMMLEKMKWLRILSIDGTTRAQRLSLQGIPPTLTQIEF